MRLLEEKIKEKLEGYQSSLPDSDGLMEFRAKLEKHRGLAGVKREHTSLWWAALPVLAACLVLFLMLVRQDEPVDAVRIAGNPIMAEAIEPVMEPDAENDTAASVPASANSGAVAQLVAASGHSAAAVPAVAVPAPLTSFSSDAMDDSAESTEEPDTKADEPTVTVTSQEKERLHPDLDADFSRSPYVPQKSFKKSRGANIFIGSLLSGGAVVAALRFIPSIPMGAMSADPSGIKYHSVADLSGSFVYPSGPGSNDVPGPSLPGGYITDRNHPSFYHVRTGDDLHHRPIRIGFSLRLPVMERLYVTTGVEYSHYNSDIGYSNGRRYSYKAGYVGVPARVDYVPVRNRWVDLYAGAGMSLDFCISSRLERYNIGLDTPKFSLLAAAGVQLNLSRTLGLYAEPQLSWNAPSPNRVMDTYRTVHPFMFSMDFGLRVTILEKKIVDGR